MRHRRLSKAFSRRHGQRVGRSRRLLAGWSEGALTAASRAAIGGLSLSILGGLSMFSMAPREEGRPDRDPHPGRGRPEGLRLKRRCTGNPRRRSTTMEERRRRTDATGNQEGRHPSRRPTGQARAASPVQVTSDLEHQRHNDQGHYCGDHLSSMAGISASYRNPCWAVRRVAADGACQRARHSAPSGCRRCTERALRYLGYLGRVPCPRYN